MFVKHMTKSGDGDQNRHPLIRTGPPEADRPSRGGQAGKVTSALTFHGDDFGEHLVNG